MITPATPPATQLLTVEEACEQLKVGRAKIHELMTSGDLAYIKLPPGTKQAGRRIEQSAVDEFVARNRSTASP